MAEEEEEEDGAAFLAFVFVSVFDFASPAPAPVWCQEDGSGNLESDSSEDEAEDGCECWRRTDSVVGATGPDLAPTFGTFGTVVTPLETTTKLTHAHATTPRIAPCR